jgi:hypothetical protein
LWLKNLPLLKYADSDTIFERKTVVEPDGYHVNSESYKKIKRFDTQNRKVIGVSNSKERARFWPGIAKAMAGQWTEYIIDKQSKQIWKILN